MRVRGLVSNAIPEPGVIMAHQLFVAIVFISTGVHSAAAESRTPATRGAARNVRQIIAHRGASAERPECTLAAIRRAIAVKATATEVDVRTSKDGHLVILHDKTLDRTTNGKGDVSQKTLAELKALDAGSWFDKQYRNERIPTLREVLKECRGKIDVLLDLKEQGDVYDRKVAAEVRRFGDAKRLIVGVRSIAQARRFRRLLAQSPAARAGFPNRKTSKPSRKPASKRSASGRSG